MWGSPVLEFLNDLCMGARNRVGLSYTGPPGYTAWRNWFLGIDSWAPEKFKNSGSEVSRNRQSPIRRQYKAGDLFLFHFSTFEGGGKVYHISSCTVQENIYKLCSLADTSAQRFLLSEVALQSI